MSNDKTAEPSVHEANKMLRVLAGERLKHTVRVHHPDGKVTEFQSNAVPLVKYNDEDRALWLYTGTDYSNSPCMRWVDGSILLTEENPKA
jgi:hypothetical protein